MSVRGVIISWLIKKMKLSKSITGKEYELNLIYDWDESFMNIDMSHYPEQIVAAYTSFGINSKVCLGYEEGSNLFFVVELDEEPQIKTARVIDVIENDEIVIIKCVGDEQKKEDKMKLVNEVINDIDLRQGLYNDVFIDMLSNVFSEERLKEILECDDVEVMIFDKLMYLRVKDRAYRL